MNFEQAVEFVGIKEGGYSSDPHDRGNYTSGRVGQGVLKGTKFGISAMSYPDLDIKNLTWSQAKSIYKRDFWDKNNVDSLPSPIRLFFFDSTINHGTYGAVIILQDAAGVKMDGVMGPKTLSAASKVTPWDFASARSDYFVSITQNGINDENDRKQLKGWLRRNLSVLKISVS